MACTVASIWFAFTVAQANQQTIDLRTAALAAQNTIHLLYEDVLLAESSQRGYLLTGDAHYLDRYYTAKPLAEIILGHPETLACTPVQARLRDGSCSCPTKEVTSEPLPTS